MCGMTAHPSRGPGGNPTAEWTLGASKGTGVARPGPQARAAATCCRFLGLEGFAWQLPCPYLPQLHPRHSPAEQPGRWVEGAQAQIPQCLGRDYPAYPLVTRVWPARATVTRLSAVCSPHPWSPWPWLSWGFCEHRGPFHLEIPQGAPFPQPGNGPRSVGLARREGGWSWSQVPVGP